MYHTPRNRIIQNREIHTPGSSLDQSQNAFRSRTTGKIIGAFTPYFMLASVDHHKYFTGHNNADKREVFSAE